MASKLIRSGATRLSLGMISLRTFSSSKLTPVILKNTAGTCATRSLLETTSKIALSNTNMLSKRFYSSEEKLSKSQVEEKVLELLKNFDRIKDNPNKPTVTLDTNLANDLGLDSLDHVEIIVQLEDTFGYEIPDTDYEKLYSPKEIVKYIQKRLAEI